MIRVTVEEVPHGIEERAHVIATATIINDGTGDHVTGNYDCEFRYPDIERPIVRRLEGWYRGRRVWGLLRRALHEDVEL